MSNARETSASGLGAPQSDAAGIDKFSDLSAHAGAVRFRQAGQEFVPSLRQLGSASLATAPTWCVACPRRPIRRASEPSPDRSLRRSSARANPTGRLPGPASQSATAAATAERSSGSGDERHVIGTDFAAAEKADTRPRLAEVWRCQGARPITVPSASRTASVKSSPDCCW